MHEEDYDLYSFLNLTKTATTDDINAAYKFYSLRYHPDKHQGNENKKIAEEMFNKVKYARDVLSDPNRRAIYDTIGHQGLRSLGRNIILRTKTPEEIYEEFAYVERLKRRKAQEESVEPKGVTTISIDATDFFGDEDYDEFYVPELYIKNVKTSQSMSFLINQRDRVSLVGQCSSSGDYKFSLLSNLTGLWPGNICQLEVSSGEYLGLTGTISRHLTDYIIGTGGLVLRVSDGISPVLMGGLVWKLNHDLILKTQLNISLSSAARIELNWNWRETNCTLATDFGRSVYVAALKLSRNVQFLDADLSSTLQYGNVTGLLTQLGISKNINDYTSLSSKFSLSTISGISMSMMLKRGNQKIVLPVTLSTYILPSTIFYGLILPPLLIGLTSRIYSKIMAKKDDRENDGAEKINELRIRAENILKLLKNEADKVKAAEQATGGLVILEALWGKVKEKRDSTRSLNVTASVQLLVRRSSLYISKETNKCDLPGFYDMREGRRKYLYIKYMYRNQQHDVVFKDSDPVKLPISQ